MPVAPIEERPPAPPLGVKLQIGPGALTVPHHRLVVAVASK